MMNYLQKLGRSIMLPIASLPVAAILMGFGYAISPSAVQESEVTGFVGVAGFFLIKAGSALIDNMSWLFAVGVAVGMADDNDGSAGIAGLVSWIMITTLLEPSLISNITGTDEISPAFEHINSQFIGILSGILGSVCYNRFSSTTLPDAFSFFAGKRSVAIFTAFVSVAVSGVLFFVWPILYGGLLGLGKSILEIGAAGAGVYAFFNRLLIPFGLHHALNSVFWFDTAGINDLGNFWASTGVAGKTGIYMSGFFPSMMFGIPGAALAMMMSVKKENRKGVFGFLGAASLCSFTCGVTEPFEFAFMFLAPGLYLVYALLFGLVTIVTVMVGFRAGFSFSGGLADLIFSSHLPLTQNIWLIIPLGLLSAVLYYIVFRFAITRFNLRTPGREDEVNDRVDGKEVLFNDDFEGVAQIILDGLGGKENILLLDNCVTRLRLEIKDYTAVNERKIKTSGVVGVVRPSKTAVQVIVGTKVQFVANELRKMIE